MTTEMMSRFKGGADFLSDSLNGIDHLKDTPKPRREDNSESKDNSKSESNESTERNQPSRQDTDDSIDKAA